MVVRRWTLGLGAVWGWLLVLRLAALGITSGSHVLYGERLEITSDC